MSVCSGVRSHRAWQTVVSATLLTALAACGGGGGGSSSTTPVQTSQPASVDARSGEKIKLGGVVSKGLLGSADVRVLAVNSDGSINETDQGVLATGSTDSQGAYLTGEFTIPGPFVVEVKARACSNTSTGVDASGSSCSFHQDEELDARQYLPTSFKIRAIVTSAPANDANTNISRVNVSLFSELAIRAAIDASGGLSAANMAKAQSMVNNLFGTTDLNTVVPAALPDEEHVNTLSPAQSRLAAMLAAASKIAGDDDRLSAFLSALSPAQPPNSCAGVTAATPQATLCVLDVLANNANLNAYVGDNKAITAELDKALQTVVTAANSAELTAVVSTTSDKLTNETLSVPVPADGAGAYTTIRNFFNDLVDYAKSLFNKDQGEPVFAEARQFETATQSVNFGGESLGRTAGVFQVGAELYVAYQQSGHTSAVSKFYRDDNLGNLYNLTPAGRGCFLADANADVITPGDAVDQVICYVDQAYSIDPSVVGSSTGTPGETRYTAKMALHSIAMVPSTDGSGNPTFTYTAVSLVDPARHVVVNWASQYAFDVEGTTLTSSTYSPQRTDAAVPADPWTTARPYTGSVTNLTYTPNHGHIKSITINGDLPDTFTPGHFKPDHHTGNVTTNLAKNTLSNIVVNVVNTTFDANEQLVGTGELTFSGTLTATQADGSTLDLSMAFSNGDMTIANQQLDTARFDVLSHNATSSFKGSARGTNGGTVVVSGALYNNATASGTPFIEATVGFGEDKSHRPNPNDPDSATNYIIQTVTFDGFVHAPNKPKIRIALTGALKKDYSNEAKFGLSSSDAISGDYFIYNADGSLKRDVTFTFTSPTADARLVTEIVDPTNKVAFTFGYNGNNNAHDGNKSDTWANVLVNKVVRGRLDTDTGDLPKVYLDNGENFSLDTGAIRY
jgi:hypothetical protein